MSDQAIISLCAHFELAQQDLDKEISDFHLDEIARTHDVNWKILTSRLGLQDVVAKDIDKDHSKEFDKRLGFFQQWKQRKGSEATYKKLVRALLDTDQKRDAEGVCKLLQPHHSNTSSGMQKGFTSGSLWWIQQFKRGGAEVKCVHTKCARKFYPAMPIHFSMIKGC